MTDADSHKSLAATVLTLCAAAGPNRTICPTDAAKAYAEARAEGPLGWRSHLQEVRHVAVALANEGRLIVYRKGKPVDPNVFRGVYRLGAPRDD
ncbi:MAG TPA: DUF3253 domain-containing protein [Roseiarcus sp.]|nr:DUF3253 domain-containing protein [Roseiarcus sp.]